MSLFLDNTAANFISFDLPVTDRPFSVGFWFIPSATTTGVLFALNDIGSTNNYYFVGYNTVWVIAARGGSTENSATGGTVTTNKYHYLVARFNSATNDRLTVLQYDGSVVQIQRTTSRTATGLDYARISGIQTSGGSGNPASGAMAEFWMTDTDIQPDGAALNADLLRTLAYKGPFAVPHIGARVKEYRSWRSFPPQPNGAALASGFQTSDAAIDESYSDNSGRTWLSTLTPTILAHPPIAHDFVKPTSDRLILPI